MNLIKITGLVTSVESVRNRGLRQGLTRGFVCALVIVLLFQRRTDMHLRTETTRQGIVCTFADAGKWSGEHFCTIENKDGTWVVKHSSLPRSEKYWQTQMGAAHYALALAHEFMFQFSGLLD